MLQEALEQYVHNIEMPLTNSGANILVITDNNINEVTELYQKLKEALVCGQGDAAWYLAQFYYNGWLFEKDIIKGDFILSIGKNFSSQKCSYTSYKGDTSL